MAQAQGHLRSDGPVPNSWRARTSRHWGEPLTSASSAANCSAAGRPSTEMIASPRDRLVRARNDDDLALNHVDRERRVRAHALPDASRARVTIWRGGAQAPECRRMVVHGSVVECIRERRIELGGQSTETTSQ